MLTKFRRCLRVLTHPHINAHKIPQVFAGIDILIKNAHKIKQVFAGIDILIKYAHKIKPVFAGIDILIKKRSQNSVGVCGY